MLKRTTVIGDASIINEFREICKMQDKTPSKVILGWMLTFVQKTKMKKGKK